MKRVHITCPYCGSRAYLRPAFVVHGSQTEDAEAKLYVCARYPTCDSYVGAHRDTRLPMGTLADPARRRKRMEAHAAMERMREDGLMTRKQTYRWLQTQLGLPEEDTHIANFQEYRCQKVVDLCDGFARPSRRAA